MVYQERFLGSSIRHYTASVGWNEQPSEIRIGLVDDDKVGDEFLGYPFNANPGAYIPGDHAIFWHQNSFNFGGIVQSMERIRGSDGNPIYEVSMRDPRFILDGVQLITSDYIDSVVGLTNIFNIYGFWESIGIGYSELNESGIPWLKVISGLTTLLNGGVSTYGGYVAYRDQVYGVYIPSLPSLPYDYRVGGGGSMSLMDFIQEICDAAGCDWFCNLEINTNFDRPLIVIYIIGRNEFLASGAIEQFTENVQGCVSNSAGIELIDSVCNKLLVGGNREDVWFTNSILPYWGVYPNGNVVLGSGNGDDHQILLDSTTWSIYGVGNTYLTDVAELRAALDSQESWEAFLWFRNTSSYPQAGRAAQLNIISDVNGDIVSLLRNTPLSQITTLKFANLKKGAINDVTNIDANKNRKNLYDIVRSYANDYYGKKFQVAIPSIYYNMTINGQEVNKFIPSRQIVESAYLDESTAASLVNNGLVPLDINSFTTNEGKFTCYVRFDNAESYDFSEIGDDEKFVQYNQGLRNYSVFIKCQVDESPVFYDSASNYSPRAVVTLPGVVRMASNQNSSYDNVGVLRAFLLNNGNTSAEINSFINRMGADFLAFGREAAAIQPVMASVPMRSNIECYGPWWGGNGVLGKVEYEKDDSLVPWNFGGYGPMNAAGEAKVIGVVSNQPWSETGHIEFPGVPMHNLGATLINGGPYISDISCSVGEDGARTTYRLNRYTPNFGRLSRYNVDKLVKLNKAWQQQKRAIRGIMQNKSKIASIVSAKQNFFKSTKAKRDKSNSSHYLLCGQKHGEKYDVVSQPTYNAMMQLSYDYTDKGGVSLDAFFRPFSTNITTDNLPHFEEPTEEGNNDGPTSTDLNPYKEGHDIQCIFSGDTPPNDLVISDNYPSETSYRPMALKGPIIICGWGYDVAGKPVPNAGFGSNNFLSGYLSQSENWKTGPLDIRWDNDRKVWVSGNKVIYIVRMKEDMLPGQEKLAEYENDEDNLVEVTVQDVLYENCLMKDEYAVAYKNGDKYNLYASHGLLREAQCTTKITNSAGKCTIFGVVSNIAGVNVTHDWIPSQNVAEDTKGMVRYLPHLRKWVWEVEPNDEPVILDEVLYPGQNAQATLQNLGESIELYDDANCNFILQMEQVFAYYDRINERWNVRGSNGLRRRCKPTQDIQPNTTKNVRVFSSSGTTVDMDASNDWMNADDNRTILQNSEQILEYFPFDRKFRIIPQESETLVSVTMNQTLFPGSTAAATRNDNGDSIIVYDEYYLNFLLAGESALIRYDLQGTRLGWKVVGSQGLIRRGLANGTITHGTTGKVEVQSVLGVSDEVDAKLDWMHGNEDIDAETELIIEYFTFDRTFRITGSACGE